MLLCISKLLEENLLILFLLREFVVAKKYLKKNRPPAIKKFIKFNLVESGAATFTVSVDDSSLHGESFLSVQNKPACAGNACSENNTLACNDLSARAADDSLPVSADSPATPNGAAPASTTCTDTHATPGGAEDQISALDQPSFTQNKSHSLTSVVDSRDCTPPVNTVASSPSSSTFTSTDSLADKPTVATSLQPSPSKLVISDESCDNVRELEACSNNLEENKGMTGEKASKEAGAGKVESNVSGRFGTQQWVQGASDRGSGNPSGDLEDSVTAAGQIIEASMYRIPTPCLPLLYGKSSRPAGSELMVSGISIPPQPVLCNVNYPLPIKEPLQNLHKINHDRSRNLFAAICQSEQCHYQSRTIQKSVWEQRSREANKAMEECKQQQELIRVHKALVRDELMGLGKSYSMYYSHLRMQGFLETGYKPSLRIAWYSKYCNHVQMKEDFREDARKVIDDWLQEKTLSLKLQQQGL